MNVIYGAIATGRASCLLNSCGFIATTGSTPVRSALRTWCSWMNISDYEPEEWGFKSLRPRQLWRVLLNRGQGIITYMRKSNATCCKCGTPCYVRPSVLQLQGNWYCSKTCYTESRYRKVARNCNYCDKPLIKKSTEAKFCSVNCSNKARAGIKYSGENSLNKVTRGKRIRRLMIEERGEVCTWCGVGNIWNGKPLTLQIDHIDGDRRNWDLSNLRFLCPNCHSQTETFGVRKVRS